MIILFQEYYQFQNVQQFDKKINKSLKSELVSAKIRRLPNRNSHVFQDNPPVIDNTDAAGEYDCTLTSLACFRLIEEAFHDSLEVN